VKLVVAVIQPTKLCAVHEVLEDIEVERMTICDAQGFGPKPPRAVYQGHEHLPVLQRKVVVEIVVNDDFLERTVAMITNVARSGPDGAEGDGKVFVLPVAEAVDICGSSRGPGAV
jgi:nitrogen regulatory protein P-II 2